MKTEKAFLMLSGRPLIEHVLDVVRRVCGRVIIVTNTPDRYTSYDAVVVRDSLDIRGPLTAIYSGLLHSEDDYHLVVGCDMPYLCTGLLSYLGERAAGYDAALPRINGQIEPLHSVYHRRLLPIIEKRLRDGRREVRGILEGARVRYITEDEIDRFDPERRSFKNLNTRREYEEALCSDWECRNS